MHLPAVFPDPFAVEWGHDQYGTFQSFAVGNVVQRMRWIPPGSFLMGSPEREVDRFDNEVQHQIEITSGFWLGDTPVPQALWEAVMGANPSTFKDPKCPVESVSWHDCEDFLIRLNNWVPGLEVRFPTEAEWEYACRAGTQTTTWVGDLARSQEKHAVQLDPIAWYYGNAELTTHPVAQKRANPWGLYDMLGNVYEWCADWFSLYDLSKIHDPRGPELGTARVLRGGSWSSYGWGVRAADRNSIPPDDSSGLLGFRLARSATPKP